MNIWAILGAIVSLTLIIGMAIYIMNYMKAYRKLQTFNEQVVFVMHQRRMPQRAEDLLLFWLLLGGLGLISLFGFSWTLFK